MHKGDRWRAWQTRGRGSLLGKRNLALIALFYMLLAPVTVVADCNPYIISLSAHGNANLSFEIEVADTARKRARGLMNRAHLAENAGMLFVFTPAQPVGFWMKDTLIPLDLLFFDDAGRLKHIHHNARPFDETPIIVSQNIRAVLEINGGLSEKFGLKPGLLGHHPSFLGLKNRSACKQ